MGRSPCCSKEGLNRGAWTVHEDNILTDYIRVHGEGRWRNLPKRAGLKRCGKSCRLRWLNYLRPDIKRGNISPDEEELIIRLHKLLGNRWSLIAGRLPGRTDNEIKNYWNTNLGKKIKGHRQTTSSRKLSSALQPNRKNNSKNPNKKPSQPAPPSPNVESRKLIRTKATKCSQVFINPRPQISTQLQSNSKPDSEEPSITDSANQILEPVWNDNGFLSFTSGEPDQDRQQEQGLTSDLPVDFKMGEICLSDLLNSDFSDVCDFSYGNNNSDELSPSSEHQPWVFSDEIFQDWTQGNFAETNVGSNLQSLTSFLESSEELLEEE